MGIFEHWDEYVDENGEDHPWLSCLWIPVLILLVLVIAGLSR